MDMSRFSLITLLMIVLISSCAIDSQKEYEGVLSEWVGKEIIFPDSMKTADKSMWSKERSDFTIVSYYDSVGCTGCRMKLADWNRLMTRIDSMDNDKVVDLIIVANSTNSDELSYLKRYNGFRHILIADPHDELNRLNQFPDNHELQCFLLDSDNRVILVGNPVSNKKIKNLYLSVIGDSDYDNSIDNDEPYQEYDFGAISKGESVIHEFDISNDSQETLRIKDIITSCECVTAEVSTRVIAPNEKYKLIVAFRDTIPGSFMRSVTILFENQNPELNFEISGNIN